MKVHINHIAVVVVFALGVAGCSQVSDDVKETGFHGAGFVNPSSENFHGKLIQTRNYEIQGCTNCHGIDYNGGSANKSCNTCHNKPNGPENCTTCHGSVNAAPPKDLADNTSPTARGVGAHQKHILGGTLGSAVACSECHVVPQKIYSAGHIDNSLRAEVRFDSTSSIYRTNATYNAANVSCTNTYCHGNFNGGNAGRTVTWTDTAATVVACGTCHGDATKATVKEKAFPQSGHTAATVTSDCSTCHRAVVDASLNIINPSKHINGKID
ncbi:MAG: CxxxxCH/CxxCH domain-containing protein [Bacteroidota bacterium]